MYYEIVRGSLTRFRAARPGPIDWLHLCRASFRHPLFTRPPPPRPGLPFPPFHALTLQLRSGFSHRRRSPRRTHPNLSPPSKPPLSTDAKRSAAQANRSLACHPAHPQNPKNHSSDNRTSAPVPRPAIPIPRQNPANPDSDNPLPFNPSPNKIPPNHSSDKKPLDNSPKT